MIPLLAAALLLITPWAGAQTLTTVNEALSTTNGGVFVSTSPPQLLLNNTTYTGLVPNVSMAASSNVVVGNCVIYSSGNINCLGVRLSTTDPAGTYVPYSGATGDVNLGTHKILATQMGSGTSPSSNFMFDGLGSVSGFVRIGAAINQATGYYWGGTRGYSLQERYDLGPTPFTLHDELNNVDRFYLDTSGGWYFPGEVTTSTLTVQGSGFSVGGSTFTVAGGSATIAYNFNAGSLGVSMAATIIGSVTVRGALNGVGIATGAAIAASLYGDGNDKTPLGVLSSSVAVYEADRGIRTASATLTGTGNGLFDLTLSSGLRFVTTTTGIVWADGSTSTSATSGGGAAGPPGPQGPGGAGVIGYVRDNFLATVTGSLKTFTLTYVPSNNSEQVNLDGTLLSPTSDYTLSGAVITMTTAPAAACNGANQNCTSAFFVQYATGATGVNAFILNSTQTVSGATTEQSTFTIGSSVYVTTCNYSSIIKGGWSIVASTAPSASTGITFTNFVSSVTTCFSYDLAQNTSNGSPQITFNNDTTAANYHWSGRGEFVNGAGASDPNNGTIAAFEPFGTNAIGAGKNLWGQFCMRTNGPTGITGFWTVGPSVATGATATGLAEFQGGWYVGSPAVPTTRVDWKDSGGTMTGNITISVLYPVTGP